MAVACYYDVNPRAKTSSGRVPCRQTFSYFTGSSLRGFSATTLLNAESTRLRQTERPNALPASWRLSLVNRRNTRCLFHQQCARTELK